MTRGRSWGLFMAIYSTQGNYANHQSMHQTSTCTSTRDRATNPHHRLLNVPRATRRRARNAQTAPGMGDQRHKLTCMWRCAVCPRQTDSHRVSHSNETKCCSTSRAPLGPAEGGSGLDASYKAVLLVCDDPRLLGIILFVVHIWNTGVFTILTGLPPTRGRESKLPTVVLCDLAFLRELAPA